MLEENISCWIEQSTVGTRLSPRPRAEDGPPADLIFTSAHTLTRTHEFEYTRYLHTTGPFYPLTPLFSHSCSSPRPRAGGYLSPLLLLSR